MKQIDKMGAQGDLLILRVDKLPDGLKEEPCKSGFVAAHSETGHHHAVDFTDRAFEAKLFRADQFTCYLSIEGTGAEIVHHRPFDTHETLGIGPGLWMLKNQREYQPEGWRRAAD